MAIKQWVAFGEGLSFDADSVPYAVEVRTRSGSACSNDALTETLTTRERGPGRGEWAGVHQLASP